METQTNNEGIKKGSDFSHLKNAAIREVYGQYDKRIKQLETEEGLNLVLSYENKKYKKNPKEKIIRYLNKKRGQAIEAIKSKIKIAEDSEDFNGNLVITLEWTASRTWGSTVKSYTNYGFGSDCISGCGYCKTSTATAQALNSKPNILKLLYSAKNEYIKNNPNKEEYPNMDILGYGSCYNMLPCFEGGVGETSHIQILKALGFDMRHISNSKMSDVFTVEKTVKEAV